MEQESSYYQGRPLEELVAYRNSLIISLMEMKGQVPVEYGINQPCAIPKEFEQVNKNPEQEAKILNEILYFSVLIEKEHEKYKAVQNYYEEWMR